LSTHPKFPKDFALEAVKEAGKIIMTKNIFEFVPFFFLQLLSTAMGTSAAVITSTAAAYDDISTISVIWLCSECRSFNWTHFDKFKFSLNNFGILKWTVGTLSKKFTFLDLNIKISGPRIKMTTYQKPPNLHLYPTGPSA
ncbi:hypothetical protein ACHAWF_005801, partial [Thalassiosira exigua]